jgi:hypothetical protein
MILLSVMLALETVLSRKQSQFQWLSSRVTVGVNVATTMSGPIKG